MNVCFPLICLEEVAPICETVAQSNQNCFAFSLLFSLVAAPVCLPLRSTAFISFTSVSMVLKLTGSISVLQNQIQNCLSKPAAPHERSLSLPLQLRNTFWRPTTKRLWVSLMHIMVVISRTLSLCQSTFCLLTHCSLQTMKSWKLQSRRVSRPRCPPLSSTQTAHDQRVRISAAFEPLCAQGAPTKEERAREGCIRRWCVLN